jgi:hypothetical protein
VGSVCPWSGGSRETPYWERLWDDFTQEELRVDATQASQPKSEEEENVALHAKKIIGGGSRDMSKVK